MPAIEIDFEWPVSPGYRIVVKEPYVPEDGRAPSLLFSKDKPTIWIVAKPGEPTLKRPVALRPTLFLDFASLDGSAEQCIEFAEKWGLLGYFRLDKIPIQKEDLDSWQRHINSMKLMVDDWKNKSIVGTYKRFAKVAELEAGIIEKTFGEYSLEIRPRSLLAAMRLQFAQSVATGKALQSCNWCGSWFETGKGSQRRTGAKFCTDACRTHFHNHRRTKEAKK